MEQRDKDIIDLEKYINNLNSRLKIINKNKCLPEVNVVRRIDEPTEKEQFKNILLQDIEPEFKDYSWIYNGRISSVKIDKEQQHEITKNVDKIPHINVDNTGNEKFLELPNKCSELSVNFSRSQKLALYDYAIKNTVSREELEIVVPVKTEENVEKKMTMVEIVAMNRDMKRRRKKYRVTKEPPITYTEDIRRLIACQMEALTDYHSSKNDANKKNEHIKSNSVRDRSDTNFDRHNNYDYDRYSQARNYKRDDYRSKNHLHPSTYSRDSSRSRNNESVGKYKHDKSLTDFKTTSSKSEYYRDDEKRTRSREDLSSHKHKKKDRKKHKSSASDKTSTSHHHSHKKKSKKHKHKHVDSD